MVDNLATAALKLTHEFIITVHEEQGMCTKSLYL